MNGKTGSLEIVTVGRDFGVSIEALAGLQGDESVVPGPPGALPHGEIVDVSAGPGPQEKH